MTSEQGAKGLVDEGSVSDSCPHAAPSAEQLGVDGGAHAYAIHAITVPRDVRRLPCAVPAAGELKQPTAYPVSSDGERPLVSRDWLSASIRRCAVSSALS
jgi:hypothetical protein